MLQQFFLPASGVSSVRNFISITNESVFGFVWPTSSSSSLLSSVTVHVKLVKLRRDCARSFFETPLELVALFMS